MWKENRYKYCPKQGHEYDTTKSKTEILVIVKHKQHRGRSNVQAGAIWRCHYSYVFIALLLSLRITTMTVLFEPIIKTQTKNNI